jgi:hypothetical protein
MGLADKVEFAFCRFVFFSFFLSFFLSCGRGAALWRQRHSLELVFGRLYWLLFVL